MNVFMFLQNDNALDDGYEQMDEIIDIMFLI